VKLDVVQLLAAADELAAYLYSKGSRKIRVSWDFGAERSYCAIASPDLVLGEADRAALEAVFAAPVQPEVAAYYGELAGRRRDGSELALLGAMTELEELLAGEGLGTRIVVSRREAEAFPAR
jgi:hypothetical protein